MDLVRAWTAAILVVVAGSIGTAGIAVSAAVSKDDLESVTGVLLWTALPTFVVFALMALVSAVVHPSPQRENAGRHALAVLLVPGLATLLGIVLGLVQGSPAQTTAASAVAGLLGAVPTWWLLARRRARRPSTGAYTGY
jgi:drug/metabolite transporter (DMT)-like permease